MPELHREPYFEDIDRAYKVFASRPIRKNDPGIRRCAPNGVGMGGVSLGLSGSEGRLMSEERIFAKCAWRLVPFMGLLYLANFIDRTNVGFAALTMNKDLGFSP